MKTEKLFMLFDGRYRTEPDRAICLEFCKSLNEAKENATEYGDDTVIVSADGNNGELSNFNILN
jgi:hypothetical protein